MNMALWLLFVKKIFARLFFPIPIVLLLLLSGSWLLLRRRGCERSQKVGRALLLSGVTVLLLLSMFGRFLLVPLVDAYKPLALEEKAWPLEAYTIVVAGSGFLREPGIPDARRFNNTMLIRLGEAVRLAQGLRQQGKSVQLVVSVSNFRAQREDKERALLAYFAQFSIPSESLVLLDNALNSRDEIASFRKLAAYPVILVSSASHMPRLMCLARKGGLSAIPAPAGNEDLTEAGILLNYVPSGKNLEFARTAGYEYLGLLEAWLW